MVPRPENNNTILVRPVAQIGGGKFVPMPGMDFQQVRLFLSADGALRGTEWYPWKERVRRAWRRLLGHWNDHYVARWDVWQTCTISHFEVQWGSGSHLTFSKLSFWRNVIPGDIFVLSDVTIFLESPP